MKKYIFKTSLILNGIFIILFVILGLKYKKQITKKLTERTGEAKIVLFGDSIIEEGKWSDLLGRNDIKNSGFRGFTSSHLRSIIKDNVIKYKPKICLMGVGINDIELGIPLKRIKTNYQSLIDTLMVHNIVPVIQSVLYQENNPQSKIMVDSINYFLTSYCEQKAIRFLNINSKLSTGDGLKSEYSKDGTHLRESAYLIWTNEIKAVLNEIESTGDNKLNK